MASEIDILLKTLKPEKTASGVRELISLGEKDLDIQRNSNKFQADMIREIVEGNSIAFQTTQKLDFGIGKIIKIVKEAQETVQPPPIPRSGGKTIEDGIQYQLEYLNLIDSRLDEQTNLQRGMLSQVTRIRSLLDEAKDRQADMDDKKVFGKSNNEGPKGPKTKLDAVDPSSLMGLLSELGTWALAPFVAALAFLKTKWKAAKEKMGTWLDEFFGGIKTWFDDLILKTKSMWDDAWKMFAKKFPKLSGMIDNVVGMFKKVFTKGIGGWVMRGVKIFGKIGLRISGILFKVAGKLIAPIMAIYDFFDGWFNADKITGIAKDSLSIWDKMSAGLASILSGLTLGFVSAQDFYEVIFGDYGLIDIIKGFFNDMWAMLPEGFKSTLSGIWNFVSMIGGRITAGLESVLGESLSSKIGRLFDDMAAWVDENVSWKKLAPTWLGGEDSEQVDLDKKNIAFAQKQRSKSVPMMLDTSSKTMSDKKAATDAKNSMIPIVLQSAPPTVITQGSNTITNVWEGDMLSQLMGR